MKLNLRAPDHLVAQVKARGDVSESVRTGLERYYHMLERGRATLRDVLTGPELSLLADVCNGTLWEPHTLAMAPANVADAGPEVAEKWGVDPAALVTKLEGVSLSEHAALVDAIERFWAATSTGMPVDPAQMLA